MTDNVPQPQGEEAYELVRELSRGAQGVVMGAFVRATGEPVAIKLIERGDPSLNRRLHRELRGNVRLSHPHVVRFRNLYTTKTHVAIVMDYANGGNLRQYVKSIGPLSEGQARSFFQQLILAVDYMHRRGIRHRDIKLDNALLHQPANQQALLLKLSDLGLCRTIESLVPGGPHSMVGSPQYAAPEILHAESCQKSGRELELVDAFSCGVFLYVCVFCKYPFDRPGEALDLRHIKMLRRMLRCDYSIPDSPQVSEDCKDLIRRLIVQEPSARATIADVLRHPFFLRALPKGALNINNDCLEAQETPDAMALAEQREDWVNRIWEQACVSSLASEQTGLDEPPPG